MRFILTIAFVLIIAVAAGLFVYQDPGYVFISYRTWGIEMPLWLAIIFGFLLLMAILLVLKIFGFFIHLPKRMMHWRTRKDWHHTKINSNLSLLAICNEDWSLVHKYATRAIKLHDQFLINYVLASFAAFQQHDSEQLHHYFHLAQKNIPDARVFIALMRAFAEWQEGHLDIAKSILLELYSHSHSQKLVVRWLYQICLIQNDWHTIEKIMPTIEDMRLLNKEQMQELERSLYLHRLHNLTQQTHSDLNQFWDTVPRYLKKDTLFIEQFIESLIHHQQFELAWKLLVQYLKTTWDEKGVELISQIKLTDSSEQLTVAEKWLHTHSDDAMLLFQLGKLCERLHLWGKARDYFEKAIKINPTTEYYLALAQLNESLHETEQALNCYRRALQLKGEHV